MSYTITTTSGNVLLTLLDGSTDNTTGLTLIGRNYPSYGQIQNDNFIRLLENFADTIPPGESVGIDILAGTLWYDSGTAVLKVYDGIDWNPVSQRIVSNTAPTTPQTGDQWWKITDQQLYVYTGTQWILVGPSFSSTQTKSGSFVETITDTQSNSHVVVSAYTANTLVSVTSFDSAFTPAPQWYYYTNFGTINKGINVVNGGIFHGTANNASAVGGISSTQLARLDIKNTFAGDAVFSSNLVLRDKANIAYSASNLSIRNLQYQGNVEFHVNSYDGNITALKIDGNTGQVLSAASPTSRYHLTNKLYVDNSVSAFSDDIANLTNQFNNDIDQVNQDWQANAALNINSQNANLSAVQSGINANVTTLNQNFVNNVAITTANIARINANVTAANAAIMLRANITSPNFQGVPKAPPPKGLVDYIDTISDGLPYAYFLDGNVTANIGQYIQQYYTGNLVITSNLRIEGIAIKAGNLIIKSDTGNPINDTRGNVLILVPISGGNTITSGIQSQSFTLALDDIVLVPAKHPVEIQQFGPTLAYTGLGDNSGNIATTSYVDATANVIYHDYNMKLGQQSGVFNAALLSNIALKANINNPVFTGVITVPTPPPNSSPNTVATVGFVSSAINVNKFNYTVSSDLPSGGNDGDFWFQIG